MASATDAGSAPLAVAELQFVPKPKCENIPPVALLGVPKSERTDGELEGSIAREIPPLEGRRRSAFDGMSGEDPEGCSELDRLVTGSAMG
jgi:hypothetical protein